jgi:hypothetical protein
MPHAQKERAIERATGAADFGEQRHADALEEDAHVLSPLSCSQPHSHLLEAALHVDAVVGVADFGVQRRQ